MVASSGFDLPLIIDDAVQLAGGMSMTAQDVQNARVALYMLLNSWSNRGYNTWRIRQNVDVVALADSGRILLDRSPPIDDIVEARVQVSAGAFTPMARISPAEYGRIATPGNAGLPTRYYLERTDPPSMLLYPIGRPGQDETIRLTYVERPAAFDRFGADVDAPARWLGAVVTGVGLALAKRRQPLDMARVQMLEADYAAALGEALGADRQRIPWRLR